MAFKPFCSTEIVFLEHKQIIPKLLSLKTTATTLILSESGAARWGLAPLIASLQRESSSFTWIKDLAPNPNQDSIRQALIKIGKKPLDAIIAIGGGSAIDLAKGLAAFHGTDGDAVYSVKDITLALEEKEYPNLAPPAIIALPTTAGTGSELTQWATVWDAGGGRKYSIDSPALQPKLALIVPELTLSLPAKLSLSTGLDAFCQAVEAYWSKHTTPIVQEIAYRAIVLVLENLRAVIDKPADILSRDKMCRASVLAGLAFAQTRTTACHSISYPLTMGYGIPHGFAATLTLAPVAERNRGHFPNDLQLYTLFEPWGGIGPWLDKVGAGVASLRLSAFGVGRDDLPLIASKAFTAGRMDNNPVILSEQDVVEILNSVYQ